MSGRWQMRRATRHAMRAMALVTAVLTACASAPTLPPFLPLAGTWDYAGTQTAPVPAQVRGTVQVNSQSGRAFGGAFSLTTTDASGIPSTDQGLLDGQIPDSTHLDFQLRTSDAARRHLGTLTADTVRGTWVETSSVGITASGNFTAIRRRP